MFVDLVVVAFGCVYTALHGYILKELSLSQSQIEKKNKVVGGNQMEYRVYTIF